MRLFPRQNRIMVRPDLPNPDDTQSASGIWIPGRHHIDRTAWDPALVFTRDDNEVVSGIVVEPPLAWIQPMKALRSEAVARGVMFSGDDEFVDAIVNVRLPKRGDRVWFSRGRWGIAERAREVMTVGDMLVGDLPTSCIHLVEPADGSGPWVPGPNVLCRPIPWPVDMGGIHKGFAKPPQRVMEKLVYLVGENPFGTTLAPGMVVSTSVVTGRLDRRVPDRFPDAFMDWTFDTMASICGISDNIDPLSDFKEGWEAVWAYNAEVARHVRPEVGEEAMWHETRDERIQHFMDLEVHKKGRKRYYSS